MSKIKVKDLKFMKKPGYTFKEKLGKKLGNDPVMILKLFAIPPIAFKFVVYLTGSIWPTIWFTLGSITTIVSQILFILWFFSKTKKEELKENI